MSAYRFCRTDDIALLVDALNRCWSPYFPDEPPMTVAAFKRSIRDLQVWCSSCMVAFSGADPIGVLIGAKRPTGTLIHRIAVHPDHRRRGHGRHLLSSLGSKLSILGPPRMLAEVPASFVEACALFQSSEYVQEATLTDYLLADLPSSARTDADGRFVIPITVDDLLANGLLDEAQGSQEPRTCWERSAEALIARKDQLTGVALASDEAIEAYLLHADGELLALRTLTDADGGDKDGGAAHLRRLLAHLRAQGVRTIRFPKVHPAELPPAWLDELGFRPAGGHVLYAARARANQGVA